MPSHYPLSTITADSESVTLSENTTGQFSTVVDIQVPQGYRFEFPGDKPMEFYAYVHESATVSETGGSTGTVSLSNDLVNSPAIRNVETASSETAIGGMRDLVVWDDQDDIQTGVDSVDYDANTFDYTNSDATADDLEIWYLFGDSSQLEMRHYTPDEESYEKELIKPLREFHAARVFDRESYVTFSEPFTMMEKEHLKIVLKTDVDLTNWDVRGPNPASSPGNFTTYGYSDFRLPVRKVPMNQ